MSDIVFADKKRHMPCSVHINRRALFESLNKNVVCIGSCFAEAISNHLSELGVNTYYELKSCYRYSAKSLADYIKWISKTSDDKKEQLTSNFYYSDDEQIVRSLRHSDLFDSAGNADFLKKKCEDIDAELIDRLRNADLIIVTLGTSRYLRHRDTGTVITNVGGITVNNRDIEVPSTTETLEDIQLIIDCLHKLAPNTPQMFTVSPQRYGWAPIGNYIDDTEIRTSETYKISYDGIVSNAYDKSKLRVCLQDSLESEQNRDKDLLYFPSYEIVLDELRHLDNFGRGETDFSHVSRDTSAYVVNRFANTYFGEDLVNFYTKYKANVKLISNLRFESIESFEAVILKQLNLLKGSASLFVPNHLLDPVERAIVNFPFDSPRLREELQVVKLALATQDIQARETLQNTLYQKINSLPEDKKLVVYGTGQTATDVLQNTTILQKNVCCFSGKSKPDSRYYFGKPFVLPNELKTLEFDFVIIAAIESRKEIALALSTLGIAPENIISC